MNPLIYVFAILIAFTLIFLIAFIMIKDKKEVEEETKVNKETLKALGCRWASKKSMWYWRNEKDAVRSRGAKSMDYIRTKYGSESYSTSELYIAL